MSKPKFTCTEYFGTEDLDDLLSTALAEFVNKKAGREIVVPKQKEKEVSNSEKKV